MSDARRTATKHGLDLRAVAWAMAALCGIVLASAGGAYLAWHSMSSTPRLLAPNAPAQLRVTGVVLESSPRPVRADYEAEKDRLLHAHEWIDAGAGIARIPIDDAMRMIAKHNAAKPAARRPQ